jgi:multiple sugar transport system substrate-binding protein
MESTDRGAGRKAVSRRGFLMGAGAALTGTALAACGGAQGPAQPDAASAVPVKITFAAHGDASWQEAWNKIVSRFNQQHGPKITAEFFSSEGDQWNKYVVLMTSGEMWDVFRMEDKRLPGFAKNKSVLDITNVAAKDKDTKKEDFPQSIWDEFFYEGKQYAFGHDLSPASIFYNRKLFKERGIALPPTTWGDKTWTWDRYLDTLKKLTFDGPAGKVYGVYNNTWWVYQHPFVWAEGGSIVSKDSKQVVFDQPAIDAMQRNVDTVQVHRVSPNAAELRDIGGSGGQAFQRGRLGMYIDNASYTITLRQFMQQDPSFDWDVAPTPTGKAGAFTRVANNNVSAWSGTKHPDAAWTFMKFMASKEATVDARGIPSRISVAALPEVATRTPNQNWKLLAEAGKVRKSELLSPYFAKFDDQTLRPAFVDVLEGKRTLREMVNDLKPRLQGILDGKEA